VANQNPKANEQCTKIYYSKWKAIMWRWQKSKTWQMTNYEIIELAPPLSAMISHIEHLLNV